MLWFIGQSVFVIAAAFLLGLLVGWLVWGLWWRRTRVDESTAVTTLRARHIVELSDRESELVLLRGRVAECEREHVALVAAPAAEMTSNVAEPEPTQPAPAAMPVPEPKPEPKPEPNPEPKPKPEPKPILEPELIDPRTVVPTEMAADDLERIEGIGPQMSGALMHAGIRTYAQLAAAEEAVLRDAIEARGLRFAPSLVTWGRQAQMLADGDEAGFNDLTRRLVAGRDEGRE